MADADPPLVRVRMPGPLGDDIIRIANLHQWRQQHDGTWRGRVSWHEAAGDGASVVLVTTDLPGDMLGRIEGQAYAAVQRVRWVPTQRTGGDWWRHRRVV